LRAILCDFGLSVPDMCDKTGFDGSFRTNRVQTANYRAPEVWLGDCSLVRGYGRPADVFSLGVVCLELIVGQTWTYHPEYADIVREKWHAYKDDLTYRATSKSRYTTKGSQTAVAHAKHERATAQKARSIANALDGKHLCTHDEDTPKDTTSDSFDGATMCEVVMRMHEFYVECKSEYAVLLREQFLPFGDAITFDRSDPLYCTVTCDGQLAKNFASRLATNLSRIFPSDMKYTIRAEDAKAINIDTNHIMGTRLGNEILHLILEMLHPDPQKRITLDVLTGRALVQFISHVCGRGH
jgi:serine/threonine protein kinase